ncbi:MULTISPECIES: sulfite exporter TauE/SafE family protein [unclassified Marinobacter]|uniref:sulfite exporter TauE/SafE family protein n=1 Tax=unclassified Marinobacter TaxID=83889 RepID=UPI0019276F56|nr:MULTISPECIES: sulfite exporter TauE/SafE family protein [unclassified Marinobacter]MBL3826040.1 sulfite exporter TauE/SafE family protein [Marinobacter sp. MC3]MBL3894385.1 sulfite exporter TauE/SafE family protein [Marinobacter sp. MW3]
MDPSIFGFSPYVAAFVFGLLGGAHCIGMCGGIMGALTFSVPPELRRPHRVLGLLLGFNAGRIVSYMVVGALVGLVGAGLSHALDSIALVLRVVAAFMLILMALYIANWWKGLVRIEAVGRHVWAFVAPAAKRFMPVVRARQAFGLGAVWGWMPCGLIYSMLAWSLSIAEPLQGAALMGAFGLGTLPTVLATGVAARRISGWIRNPATRTVAALLIISFATWQLWHLQTMSAMN